MVEVTLVASQVLSLNPRGSANFRLGKKGHSLVPLVGMDEPSCGGRALV